MFILIKISITGSHPILFTCLNNPNEHGSNDFIVFLQITLGTQLTQKNNLSIQYIWEKNNIIEYKLAYLMIMY